MKYFLSFSNSGCTKPSTVWMASPCQSCQICRKDLVLVIRLIFLPLSPQLPLNIEEICDSHKHVQEWAFKNRFLIQPWSDISHPENILPPLDMVIFNPIVWWNPLSLSNFSYTRLPPVWIALLCRSWGILRIWVWDLILKIASSFNPDMVFLNPRNETHLVFFKFWLHQAFYGVNGLAL